ncbi:MAG TPA: transglycosylase SLT domain-containing protein [Candidatus Prevotella stercoripullorum]|nr:transglycosylase SLT domain-containing protein [Candidatus Prevotella stercoripullorum]
MRKKTFIIIAAMILGGNCVTQAQNEKEEITVTDDDGKEEIIDVPEAMNYEVDSLLNLYYSKTYLQPDNDCNYRDENKTYPKETYIERLSRLPNVMEMPYNNIVQQFIDRYTGRLRHSVSYMLGASNFYTPIFEEALESYGLPLELKYLPVIESALNPMATSHAGAAGLWQFMVATGKQYGLEVNSLVDERRDPVKSSFAAARYLKDLYNIFGDWSLVIAAYNCGPENINKAIHRAGGEADYWKIYPYLPRETRGYVPAFIAANYVMNYYCEHNICPMRTQLPAKTDTIIVNKDVHLKQIAEVCGIDIDELRTLNPQYRRDIVNGSNKPSIIRMPATATNTFIANEDSIYNYKADALFTRRSLVEVDNTTNTSSVRKSATKRKSSSRRRRRSRVKRVTIRQGDTLSEIAERNHTTVKKLRQLNGIRGNNIRAGKKIRVR